MRRTALAIGVLGTVLIMSAPALAYPSKAAISEHQWYCYKNTDIPIYLYFDTDNNYYKGNGEGKYRYKRDVGKIQFRTGPWEEFFGKLHKSEGDWTITIKRDATKKWFATCLDHMWGDYT